MITFNQYIKYPTAGFSNLSNRYKLSLISIYIILLPVCPIHILLLQHIILMIIWNIEFKRYRILYRRWLQMVILVYIFYLTLAAITSSSQMVSFCIPYKVQIVTCTINICNSLASNNFIMSFNLFNIDRYLHVDLPLLITRGFLVIINYLSLYNFIMLITPTEQLMISLAHLIQTKNRINSKVQDSIIIILFSYELISILQIKLKHSKNCLTLRGLTKVQIFSEFKSLIKLILYKYKQFCVSSIYNLTYVIYSRELLYYSPSLWLII
uniref:Transmembrane protein n=1 Tax=Liagora harveyana TaxID=406718 RepID=A0A1G4NV45_9FLOR|nr:Hypothetical protein ORF_5 [Liagora harveyana]SCW22561.1 Hypothetical protein ORF_5 [Liagora harveyana]